MRISFGIRAAIVVAVMALIFSIPIHDESRIMQELENSGHGILFGIAAIALLKNREAGIRHCLTTALFVVILGIGTELLQWIRGMDIEALDVLRDVAGAVAFLGIFRARQHRDSSRIRFITVFIAVIIMLAVFTPPMLTASAIAQRWHRFPVITDFESSIGSRFCSAGNARFDRISRQNGHAGRIQFQKDAQYSGFAISGPFPDWSGYQSLAFTVFSGQKHSIQLFLRIHDGRHNNDYRDRYNAVLQIHPGINEIRIPMDAIERSPQKRSMNLRSIRAIGLFLMRPEKGSELIIDNFQLERNDGD